MYSHELKTKVSAILVGSSGTPLPKKKKKKRADFPFEIFFHVTVIFVNCLYKGCGYYWQISDFENLAETMNVVADSAGSQNISIA